MMIDRERCPAFTFLVTGLLLPVIGFILTKDITWRAHVYVPTELITPADLTGHNGTLAEDGTAKVMLWHIHPHTAWPLLLALIAYEVWILQQRALSVGEQEAYSYAGFGDNAGAFVAHTEFWIVSGFSHALIFIFAFSPVSVNFVGLFVLLVMLALAAVCEPNNDHGATESHDELTTNRVMLIALPTAAALFVYMANNIVSHPSSKNTGSLLVVLAFVDLALVLTHSNAHASFQRILRGRCYYALALGVTIVFWLWGQDN
jgi:hypothetical protein